MNISKIMTKKVITTNETSPNGKAISMMETNGIKEIPVLSKGKFKGLLVYYDIPEKIKSNNEKVENFVRSSPILSSKDSIEKAIDLMLESGITGLPVIDEGRLVGIVSDFDILRLLINNHVFDNLKVSDVLIARFPILRQEDSIELAMKLMSMNNVDGLPIIDNFGKVVGEIFLTDVLSYYLRKTLGKKSGKLDHQPPKGREENVMSLIRREFPSIVPTLNLRKALEMMLLLRIKATVIIDAENRPVGILSRLKILSLLREGKEEKPINVEISGEYDLDFGLLVRSKIFRHEKLLSESGGIKSISVHVKKIKGEETPRYEISLNAFGKKRIALKANGISREQIMSDLVDNLIELVEQSKS